MNSRYKKDNNMPNSLEFLGEYFLGTKTRRKYAHLKNTCREFISDDNLLKKMLGYLKFEERTSLLSGKYVPNCTLAIGALLSVWNPNFIFLAMMGEVYRGGYMIGKQQAELSSFEEISRIKKSVLEECVRENKNKSKEAR